jgi:hypothetical protein
MTALPDFTHDCDGGGGPAPGLIPVQRKAASSCCGAKLAEGGTPETGFTCSGCSEPAERVQGPATAHWTCTCGQPRHQVLTDPEDG